MLSGAAGQIRTGDLILTNRSGVYEALCSGAFELFSLRNSSRSDLLCNAAFNPDLHLVGQTVGQDSAGVPANEMERSKPRPGTVADCSFP